MDKIVVVDQDRGVRQSLLKVLPEQTSEIIVARSCEGVMEVIRQNSPHMVLLNIDMPGTSAMDLLRELRQQHPRTPVIVTADSSSSETLIGAMKHGAFEFLEKPLGTERAREKLAEALAAAHMMREEVLINPSPQAQGTTDRIIGRSAPMQEVCKMIGRVAASDVTVLIMGETGTGKELVARAIYQHSHRSERPFLAVNCAAIPDTLLESELFGHEKGAFTGAVRRKPGKFEQVSDGTIFLDEIGDMSLMLQAKLLRILQEGTFERLGDTVTLRSNARVIAATNRNLEQAIADRSFREDLYYRLKVITITLPPLRHRREDLPELIQFFLAKHSGALGRQDISLTPEARQKLISYRWPGNVRELEHVLKRSILMCKGGVIGAQVIADDFKESLPEGRKSGDILEQLNSGTLDDHRGTLYNAIMDETEKELIIAVLRKVNGNQVQAAKWLGISRVMLHDRIERYGIRTEIQIKRA